MKKSLLGLAMAGPPKTIVAESVDLDGVNDYFSRASDFVGNADGKTFTFSCWVYRADASVVYTYSGRNTSPVTEFEVLIGTSGDILCVVNNAADTRIIRLVATSIKVPLLTWTHVMLSVDLTNAAKRWVVINDIVDPSPTFSSYIDDVIDFTHSIHRVGRHYSDATPLTECRLSNVFLDYTYRDLSIEANRRLFTTIDPEKGLIPADGQAALNPIMYLSMDDPTTAHINEGTGGDFVQNGTIARSNRGPNQYNAVASEIDGSNFLTYADSAVNGTLSFWKQANGITQHDFSTGAVSLTNITSAIGDVISDVYLSQTVEDENKFIDDNGKPLYLGETGEKPSGLQPGTYFKMRADQPEVNDGSGSDAVATGAPFVGARGGSEYWARGAVVDGSNYLVGNIFCQSLVKWKSTDSGVTWAVTYANSVTVTNIGNGTDNGVVSYYFGTSESINFGLESETLRFTDGLGFPVPPVQDANTVLFLDFSDTSNFGLNQAGADFIETGTITAGADVNV